MNSFIEYAIKSGISLSVFYLFYWIILQRDTRFWINRLVLMFSVIVSMALPAIAPYLVNVPVAESLPFTISFGRPEETAVLPGITTVESGPLFSFNLWDLVAAIYVAGAIVVAGRLVYQAIFLQAVSRLSDRTTHKGFTIVSMHKDMVPFSYFNKIYIPAAIHDHNSLDNIIAHEKSHLSQGHYIDLFIIEVITILQWFNPFIWLFEKSVKEVHEYLADQAVLNSGQNAGNYQAILVNQALGGPVFILTNQFNQSLIKKRIMMMKSMKKSRLALLKALLIVPLTAGLLLAFATPPKISKADIKGVQDIKVTGNVTDKSTGKGLEGAVVVIRGTTTGTITDKDGNYSIIVKSTGDELAVSHLRYETQVVRVGNNTKINVQLDQYVLDVDFSSGNKLNIDENVNQGSNSSKESNNYVFVEELPGYPGGTDALHKFLLANLKYPQDEKNRGIQGTVLTTFIIDEQGKVTSAKIIRGISKDIDLEALRLTNLMKGWKPASQNGKPVSMIVTMPIEFTLN